MSSRQVTYEDYRRVLFPRRGTDRERLVEVAICAALAASRGELVRTDRQRRGAVRVAVAPGFALGQIEASVCPQCPWVSWPDVEHGECFGVGQRQGPDVNPSTGAMVVDLGAPGGDDGSSTYEATLYPPRITRAWGRFQRRTSGARIARRLWDQREGLVTGPGSAGSDGRGDHVGVVLDAVPEIAHAGCLTCTWIGDGTSMADQGWRDRVLADARGHEQTGGAAGPA